MKLDVLCRFRAQVEEYVRIELAELDRLVAEATEAHARQRAAADGQAMEHVETVRVGADGTELSLRFQQWEGLEGKAIAAEAHMAQVLRQRQSKQGELEEAARRRKQMELLVQRRANARQERLRRHEQRELDDFASRRWAAMMGDVWYGEGRR